MRIYAESIRESRILLEAYKKGNDIYESDYTL